MQGRRCANARMHRRPGRRVGCPKEWRRLRAADGPRAGATAHRPHSRYLPVRWRESRRSFAGYFGFAHMAQAQPADDVIAEIRGITDGIERLYVHLLAND